MNDLIGHKGGKGGGDSHTPVEAPDSLHSIAYARIIDLISEGEVEGLVGGMKGIYLDDTPLQNASGSMNYSDVTVHERMGTPTQDFIPGFPSVESEISIATELRSDSPWIRAISNLELNAVRIRLSVLALSKANTSNGDINGYRVNYAVDVSTDGGAYVQVLSSAFNGKTTSKYERSHRIALPAATTGWSIRVRRLTANADSSTIADTTRVESITEIIDAKLRYPNSAVVGISIDSSQFSNIPRRAYLMKGRRIRVPSNYNPTTRAYSGVWDGTFQVAWTDNPAWIYYDLATHERYGLGHLVTAAQVDKWRLYQIAQYCDQMVPDGKGGTEPRYTAFLYLQSRADAYRVLRDIASIFRGMAFWAGGYIQASADMPSDPVYTYTNANVIDGRFTYAGTGRRTRHTVALVSWNDPDNRYRPAVEYVADEEGIARYGVQSIEVTATGCVSQGQAHRLGKYILATERLQTDTVMFSVGLEGAIAAPGQIIRVADAARAGRRIAGRVVSATTTVVEVDRAPTVSAGDTLTITLPTGTTQTRTVSGVSGRYITVVTGFTAAPVAQSIWVVETASLVAQQYRVLSITEVEPLRYDITALQHSPAKYDEIELGLKVAAPPITVLPPSVQPPATAVTIAGFYVVDQGVATAAMTISWAPAADAVAYDVSWRHGDDDWVYAGRVGTCNLDVRGIYTGDYSARVVAINASGVQSIAAFSSLTSVEGKTGAPQAPSGLVATSKVFGIDLAIAYPAGVSDTERTEIWYSASNDRSTAIKLIDLAYPQNRHSMIGLSAGVEFYFWARLVDKTGNIGGWYPASSTAGVLGAASSDASTILAYLTEQLTETQIAAALLDRIETGEAAATAVTDLLSDLAAVKTIKTQLTVGGRTYLAGIALGVDATGDTVESAVLIAADKFAIIDPSDTATVVSPFVVAGGQVFVDEAFIRNLTASNVTAGSLTADRLAAKTLTAASGVIDDAAVGTLQVADAAITSLKVADAAITTLKVAGNSITAPVGAYTTGEVAGPNVQSITLTNPDAVNPSKVLLVGSCSLRNTQPDSDIAFADVSITNASGSTLARCGVRLGQDSQLYGGAVTASAVIGPGASATFYLRLTVVYGSAVFASFRSLVGLVAAR